MFYEISFKNYRGFKEERFQFNNKMNVLIGRNCSGKTSVLDGLATGIDLFLRAIDEKTDRKNISKGDVRFSIEEIDYVPVRKDYLPTEISYKSRFINEDIEWTRRKTSLENTRTISKDSARITNVVKEMVCDIRSGAAEGNIVLPVFSYHGSRKDLNLVKDMKVLEKTERISRFFGYRDCLNSASNYKVFVNWYRKMKFREFQAGVKIPVLKAIEEAVRKMLIILTEDEENGVKDLKYLEGEMAVVFASGEVIPLSCLSDEYKNVIAIVFDIAYRMAVLNPALGENILRKTPGVVLIDEIEQHINSRWQEKILGALKSIFPRVQFVVTTHSQIIIDAALENEVIDYIIYRLNNIDDIVELIVNYKN